MSDTDGQGATERIVQSQFLQAWSRLAMALGVPLILSVLGWGVTELVDVRRRITAIEAAATPRESGYDRRLSEIERRIGQGDQVAASAGSRLGAIESSVASLAASQTALLRSMERIERVLDSSRNAPR